MAAGVLPIVKLKAFGLVVRGDLTYYRIAEAIGIAAINPSTAAARARIAAIGGWKMVRKQRRWRRLRDWNVIGAPHFGARVKRKRTPGIGERWCASCSVYWSGQTQCPSCDGALIAKPRQPLMPELRPGVRAQWDEATS